MIFALFEKKVRKMKRLLLLLALLLPAALFAQDEQSALRIPDEDDIALRTMDASSPYYYTNLMLKYRHGTAPLTPEEYYYLYYGYAYQQDYRPFASNTALERMLSIMSGIDPDRPQVGQLEALIEYGTEAMEHDPFSPKTLNMMAYAYGALGRQGARAALLQPPQRHTRCHRVDRHGAYREVAVARAAILARIRSAGIQEQAL